MWLPLVCSLLVLCFPIAFAANPMDGVSVRGASQKQQQIKHMELYQLLISLTSSTYLASTYILSASMLATSTQSVHASKRYFETALAQHFRVPQIQNISVYLVSNTLNTPTDFNQLIIVFLDGSLMSELSEFVVSSPLLHDWQCIHHPIIKSLALSVISSNLCIASHSEIEHIKPNRSETGDIYRGVGLATS